MTAENKAGKLAYYSTPPLPNKARSHGGKEKEEALLLRGPHNKERWNTRSSVASRLIVTTCLSFQASKTRPKEFGALEFSAGNGKMSFSIVMVSARVACPCLLIQTKQQPLVLRAEAQGGNQGYGFKAALLTGNGIP